MKTPYYVPAELQECLAKFLLSLPGAKKKAIAETLEIIRTAQKK